MTTMQKIQVWIGGFLIVLFFVATFWTIVIGFIKVVKMIWMFV